MSDDDRMLSREEIMAAGVAPEAILVVTVYDSHAGVFSVEGSFLAFPGNVMEIPDQLKGGRWMSVSPVTVGGEVQPGTDMSFRLGDSQDKCPSCGGKDDHNWMRSEGGMIACQKRNEAHVEGS